MANSGTYTKNTKVFGWNFDIQGSNTTLQIIQDGLHASSRLSLDTDI